MQYDCPHCGENIQLKQEGLIHAGFSNEGFLYCDKCPSLVVFSSFNKGYQEIVKDKHPWDLSKEEKALVERCLINCSCGGKYLFNNKPKCPSCKKSVQKLLPGSIYYMKMGDVISDEDCDIWKSE